MVWCGVVWCGVVWCHIGCADAAAYYLQDAVQKGYSTYAKGSSKQGGPIGSGYMPDFTHCIDHFALHAGECQSSATCYKSDRMTG